jgi:phosphoglycolate phosphatase-like HAD superfamily hydrolase
MSHKHCVIFDCDGPLVDSECLCNLGLQIGLQNLGIAKSADELGLFLHAAFVAMSGLCLHHLHRCAFDNIRPI